jgi:hypothetical protein
LPEVSELLHTLLWQWKGLKGLNGIEILNVIKIL